MNYIINHSNKGYTETTISDIKLQNKENSIVVIIDSKTDGKLQEYYSNILKMIVSGAKISLIVVGENVSMQRSICNLMASYKNYNMYKAEDIELVDEEFILKVISREPTYEEVQSFIGGEITGYSDLSTIVIGINSLVNNGDIDGLREFIQNHVNSIESLTEVIEYMKNIVDTDNSGELVEEVNKLKDDMDKMKIEMEGNKKEIDSINNKLKEEKKSKVAVEKERDSVKNELLAIKEEVELIKEQSVGGNVIRTYSEVNTSMINCKVVNILYFKEISYVRYTNSFINSIAEALKAKRLKYKMLIYDNANGASNTYRPIPVVGSKEYIANKSSFLRSTEKLVVVEPNQMIVQDILTNTNPTSDVLIIFDRLKQTNDIVTGNNVHKYYMMNCYKDYIDTKNAFKINDSDHIITQTDSSLYTGERYVDGELSSIKIPKERMDIQRIDGYNEITDTARVSKYMKLLDTRTNKPVIGSILKRMRI